MDKNNDFGKISTLLQSTTTPLDFARLAISELAPKLGGGVGVFYIWDDAGECLQLLGSYGLKKRRHLATTFKLGEGLAGQCALEHTPIILTEVPDDYVRITSTFTLILPLKAQKVADKPVTTPSQPQPPTAPVPASLQSVQTKYSDDSDNITPKDETILIIEDDASFAKIVCDLSRKRGFKCLLAEDGVIGLELAKRYRPTGIVLDVGLPRMDGWTVMERLKQQPETRHIPVHFMSATDAASWYGNGRSGLFHQTGQQRADRKRLRTYPPFRCIGQPAGAASR